MPRFFLADPSLISASGHCWSYLRSLGTPVKEAGYEPVVLGNRRICADLQAQADATALFQHWCDDRLGSHVRTAALHRKAIRADLAQATRQFSIGPDDIVLLNSLRHWPLAGVVDWLEWLPSSRRPFVALVLHFTAYPDPHAASDSVDFYRDAFRRIETSPARDRLLLLADSQELIDEYRTINDRLHYELAPIPHSAGPLPQFEKSDGVVRLGCVGEARENKGFHLLPYLVHRVLDSAGCENVQFHLHAFTPDRQGPFFRRIEPRLNRPGVTLYPEMLDDEQYDQFLAQLDVVILPYTLANYHSQTSGVFAEALAQKKAVVCPRGTWMARQTFAFEAGAVFAPDDVEDLVQQTLFVIGALPGFQALAGETRSPLGCAIHNPQRLLAPIFEAAGATTNPAHCRIEPVMSARLAPATNAARFASPSEINSVVCRHEAAADEAKNATRLASA